LLTIICSPSSIEGVDSNAKWGRSRGCARFTIPKSIVPDRELHCPTWLVSVVVLLLAANAINIGADLGVIADASRLVIGGPYLFFWQAPQEAEDVQAVPTRRILRRAPEQAEGALNRIHVDTLVGMRISNFIALAIVITAAATLHAGGVTDIQTTAQAAAQALRPIAGPLAEAIFASASSAPAFCLCPFSQARRLRRRRG
jgi:hypothetical protein